MTAAHITKVLTSKHRPAIEAVAALLVVSAVLLGGLSLLDNRIATGAETTWREAITLAAEVDKAHAKRLDNHDARIESQTKVQQDLRDMVIEIRSDVKALVRRESQEK